MTDEATMADIQAAIDSELKKPAEPDTSDIPEQGKEFFDRAKLKQLRPVPAGEVADFDRLLAIGEKLLKQRREKAIHLETEYQKARLAIANNCRVQMERLKIDAEDQLRALDQAYAKDVADNERTIMALKGMRG